MAMSTMKIRLYIYISLLLYSCIKHGVRLVFVVVVVVAVAVACAAVVVAMVVVVVVEEVEEVVVVVAAGIVNHCKSL